MSEALAKRQAEIYAEITRFVPEKELVGIFRLKYDYHNAKTIVKGEGAGVDAAYLLSDAGQVEPEKLEAAFREDSFQFIPGKARPRHGGGQGHSCPAPAIRSWRTSRSTRRTMRISRRWPTRCRAPS